MKKLLLTSSFLLLTSYFAPAAIIEAEGRAPGDMKTAREMALADALREAVRVGTGVDVLSSTGVSDFTLEYDRILSSAFEHVKSYKVLNSGLGQDGICRVRVSAEVEKGTPVAKNTLALRQLVLLKNSPRLAIRISGPEGQTASALLEESARDLQIQIVPPGTPADFEITGDLALRHTGRETLHDSPPQNVFTLRHPDSPGNQMSPPLTKSAGFGNFDCSEFGPDDRSRPRSWRGSATVSGSAPAARVHQHAPSRAELKRMRPQAGGCFDGKRDACPTWVGREAHPRGSGS